MRKKFILLFLLISCLYQSVEVYAQFRGTSPKRLIKRVEKYSCPILFKSDALQGIGIKLGDPVAITYKKYFYKRYAFEGTAGITTAGFYSSFIDSEFFNIDPAEFEADSLILLRRRIRGSAALQLRIVMHNPLPAGITGDFGVDWYVGLGLNARYINVRYEFQEVIENDPLTLNLDTSDEEFFLVGPEAVIGIEHAIKKIRTTVFLEGSYFFNLIDIGSNTRFFGAVGGRYNF